MDQKKFVFVKRNFVLEKLLLACNFEAWRHRILCLIKLVAQRSTVNIILDERVVGLGIPDYFL